LFHPIFFLGFQAASVNTSLNGVQQFQPILQRWYRDTLPTIIPLLPMKEEPVAPDMLGINLQLRAIFRHSLPAYLSFRHTTPRMVAS